MQYSGNIRKMKSALEKEAVYKLPLYHNLIKGDEVDMNNLIGKEIEIRYSGQINCIVTGKKIKKTYGDGMSYDAFMESPLGCPSIVRPELSRIHEGIALRDEAWEREHHLAPHFVYLSKTSGIKVGVTRHTQIPTRWIDQGAAEAVILAKTPYRQAAGLIEVALKEHFADKTNWRKMLKNEISDENLISFKRKAESLVPEDLKAYLFQDDTVTSIHFPVQQYPDKVKSLKLETAPIIVKTLVGIKGQYLIFDDSSVLNLRSHTGYHIEISY